MDVWHVLFPRDVQCVHVFVARVTRLFTARAPTISEATGNLFNKVLRVPGYAPPDPPSTCVLFINPFSYIN